ncbi:MAG TPA: proline--tRNA ligase [archaeon]|nr:proline--tRNA ligase [archaeon]
MSEELGVTVKRSEDFSKWYLEVVRKGNFIDQRSPIKGFDVIMPWGYAVWETIQKKFDGLIKDYGVQNCYFPMLIPERLLKKEEEHMKGFKAETIMATEAGGEKLEERYALRPTSETIMYYMFNLWVRSYKDLPLKVNQWCNIVRWDTKVTKPFLRGREFLWQEGHTAHETREDAEQLIGHVVAMYYEIYKMMAITPMILVRPKSDTFAGADFSVVFDTMLQDGKVSQGPGTHMLGQHFSKAFDIQFLDKDNVKKHVWQTSWGLTTRQIGILIMHHGDDKGAVLPPLLSPVQVAIVPILFKGKEDVVKEMCRGLAAKLKEFRIQLDDREYTAGFKFNDWELKGVPLRIELGPRDIESGEVAYVTRLGAKGKLKNDDSLMEEVKKLLDGIQDEMSKKSEHFLFSNIHNVTDLHELKEKSEKGGWFRGNWCGSGECEALIKSQSGGAEIRGTLYNKEEKCFAPCLHCGKEAKHVVYIARAY